MSKELKQEPILPVRIEQAIRVLQIIDTTDYLYIDSEFIARHTNMERRNCLEVLKKLTVAGVLASKTGCHGGYGRARKSSLEELFIIFNRQKEKKPVLYESVTRKLNSIINKLARIAVCVVLVAKGAGK